MSRLLNNIVSILFIYFLFWPTKFLLKKKKFESSSTIYFLKSNTMLRLTKKIKSTIRVPKPEISHLFISKNEFKKKWKYNAIHPSFCISAYVAP